jgi:hypothetical protein
LVLVMPDFVEQATHFSHGEVVAKKFIRIRGYRLILRCYRGIIYFDEVPFFDVFVGYRLKAGQFELVDESL